MRLKTLVKKDTARGKSESSGLVRDKATWMGFYDDPRNNVNAGYPPVSATQRPVMLVCRLATTAQRPNSSGNTFLG
eukprot:846900-Rhodomonas_salina.1